ncbi:MAG: hypothetical protein CVU18_13945 [Betaproteobacteria bacterium HGW-Betaproteobacteria-12]|nr:MAG: hypothetical protein CVU18_13945 [Betaproteobacteria bacterium HGW-Betaproteobacteria-12]
MVADDRKLPDMTAVAARVVELMGGREQVIASMEAEYYAMKARWNKDVLTIGRILRAHLHVEYYLTEFLQHTNPKLGDLDEARITFNQKINLLQSGDRTVELLIPGIRHLNKIRNRLAHNLDATVTEGDATVFLQGMFNAFREAGASGAEKQLSTKPIDVLEEFAEFASSMLHAPSGQHSKAFDQAMKELSGRTETP